MSLPPKVVPKTAAVAVSGPGSGPSPSSQLRTTLTSVSLPPGAPNAPPPGAVPPPQIPRVQPSLDDRIFPTQPGVAAVYSVSQLSQPFSQTYQPSATDIAVFLRQSAQLKFSAGETHQFPPKNIVTFMKVPRHAGPPYSAHDITKGHPNLAGTPPGHAHSPALTQVSLPTASQYRYPKGWETGVGSPYNPGQNAGSAPLVYSPQTQPMNAQPQSRPVSVPLVFDLQHACLPSTLKFATGPRPTHHQFFQRTQMQTARPTIPTNAPSIRPGSQTPTAAVYPTNQPIMMTMAPMPFPSPQAAQYYIPQYRHSTPYVGPPQQYSVQPPGSGTFYPGPGPGEYPSPYHPLRYHPPVSPSVPAPVPTAGPPYYPGQSVYPPSPPIIVPTPQQPPPAKREKKTIRIRDPNQGGRDITEEIMAGGSGSRNSTPPVGRPSSTPTPPQQQLSSSQTPEPQQQSQPPQPQQAHPGGYTLEPQQPPQPPQPQQPQQPSTTGASDTKPGPDDMPKLEPVVQKSSSPGLVQPEAPVERLEAKAPVTEPSSTVEPELPSPALMTAPATLPLSVATNSERPSARESTASASSPSSTVGEHKPSLAPPQTPNTDKPLSDAPRTPAASPAPDPKALNGLADSGTELDTPAPEPSLLSSAALQPQASAPACREASSSDTLPSDVRPELPVAAAAAAAAAVAAVLAPVAPVAPVAVVPVTLTSSPAPALPVSPPPGLPPLVQATTEADEPSKSLDLVPRVGAEELGGITDSKTESQQQALTRKSPTTVNQSASAIPKTWRKPNEGISAGDEPQKDDEDEPGPVDQPAGEQALQSAPLCSSLVPLPAVLTSTPAPAPAPASSPEAEGKPATPEENGEAELEPMGNGAGHTSETESSDGGATPADKENSTGAPQEMEDLAEASGKRQYNRDFLLGFQFMPACVQKPEGLPPISDVVLDKINQNKLPSRVVESRVISRGPDFTPAFADFGRQQMSGGRGAAIMNIGARRPPPRKIIMNVSVNEIQLKKSENAWKPGMKRPEVVADDPIVQDTQELFKKVRSILNKLTPQKFNQLMKQVTDLTIDTEERLKGVIDLVFEKALDEPSFSVAYGNMCRCLATLKVTMTDKPNTTVNFRKLLLNRCQKEFEKDKVDDVVFERKQKELDSAASTTERERLQEELKEAKEKARRRSMGNIRFIGELFKLKMLTEAIMHDCVVKLLKNHDEESLECLCRLLTTIGKDLDFEKAKPRMDQYFNQMEKIVKERKTSSRIRFMLQDIIDLRLHNWVSRRADQGPKTIEQIHKEAKIEEQEEQRKVQQQLLSKDSKRRPDPRDQRDQRDQREQREQRVQREETWNTVPMTKNSRTIDPTKIPKISKPQMDEKIQLGPRAQVTWVKGSSGGAKASDSELSRTAGLNRYSALQSTPQPSTTPPQNPDFDSRRTLGSRSSGVRERSEKPLSSAAPSSRPGPFTRGGSSKELLESPTPEEPRKDREQEGDEPWRQSVSEDKAEPERSRVREPVKPEPAVQTPDKPALSEEEMERKSKSIIDEFLHLNDYKEAVQCVNELDLGSQLHTFVCVGVESTLERSQITRDHMGQLLFLLVQQDILPKPLFFKGFADILEQADDMSIDIPHIWLYLAELLSPVLKEGGFSMRDLFSELSKPLLPVGRAGILISEMLHILCKQMSHRTVCSLWRDSGLNWTDFLPEGEDVQAFISQQKLQFILSDGSGPEAALSKKILSPEELSQQLERLLLEDMASDEQIFDWVEANLDDSQMSSSPFLRALMTAVCKAAVKDDNTNCRVDTAIIQRRLPVLLKYLNSDTERQLQALYALQMLIVALDQPPNLLRMFFDVLYDEDVISEDAFYNWETSKDPAEQQGKGVALKSVTAFFTWLREAEEESEDN
ncbi:eukaryotic translation initiation factor 4 gamma 3 isoform X3 [Cottoperca gobio]|uniref:Eukaryotic translation initiation factor 4 gamma 3 isoform X3 n=1 Tax=Cottoperca gobio TaxID=56716 RepID=A0A6J2PMR6_COTGO|nr:eukaryotic translation initiation factor 4 gamma 3 isoform X3 [Cottoperca gobio]